MKRWLVGALAGLALATGLCAYAVSVGGFPSRPWLQALGIGEAAPSTAGNVAATGTVSAGSFTTTGAINGGALAITGTGVAFFGSSGYSFGYGNTHSIGTTDSGIAFGTDGGAYNSDSSVVWSEEQGGANQHFWECKTGYLYTDDFACVAQDDSFSGNAWLDVTRSGNNPSAVNFPNGAVEQAGFPLDMSALVTISGSSCAVATGTGFTGCTYNSTGNYTLHFATLPRQPVCIVAPVQTLGAAIIIAPGTTSVEVNLYNMSSTLMDSDFDILCG